MSRRFFSMKMVNIFYLILVLMFGGISCSTLLQYKNNIFFKIVSQEMKRKTSDVKQISLGPIVSKTLGFSNFAGTNFTENLRFNLIKKGYDVIPYTKKKQNGENEDPMTNVSNASSPPRSQTSSPTPLSPQAYSPISTPVKLGKQESQITDPLEISEICKSQNSQIYIGGFIYEGRTGPLLNEEVTAGIILSLYDANGILLTQIQYIGDLSMEEFQNSSEVARIMSEKVKGLLK